jgi:hypothetical protein
MYWKKDGGTTKSPFGPEIAKCDHCGWALSKRIDIIETGPLFGLGAKNTRSVCSKRCLANYLLRHPGVAVKVFMRGHARAV